MHHPPTTVDLVRLVLGLTVIAVLWAVPFTALRHVPIPRLTKLSGLVFLLSLAVFRVVAVLDLNSPWWLINDGVQLIAIIVFVSTLTYMVASVVQRRGPRIEQQAPVDADSRTD